MEIIVLSVILLFAWLAFLSSDLTRGETAEDDLEFEDAYIDFYVKTSGVNGQKYPLIATVTEYDPELNLPFAVGDNILVLGEISNAPLGSVAIAGKDGKVYWVSDKDFYYRLLDKDEQKR